MLEPIRITEGKVDAGVAYHDLRFIGVRLDPYEGEVVTFRIGPSTGTWRTGTGQVRIVNGGFDVLVPQLVAPGRHPRSSCHVTDVRLRKGLADSVASVAVRCAGEPRLLV